MMCPVKNKALEYLLSFEELAFHLNKALTVSINSAALCSNSYVSFGKSQFVFHINFNKTTIEGFSPLWRQQGQDKK